MRLLKVLSIIASVFVGIQTFAQSNIPSYVPSNGLVGYWPFNGNANDESGNGNDGVVNRDVPILLAIAPINNLDYFFNSDYNKLLKKFITSHPFKKHHIPITLFSIWDGLTLDEKIINV
jgi:hypothetical protein